MTHVICQPCIGVKDKSCVDVCPVDCIHGAETDTQLYINPNDCIDCTLCVDACPVDAIFALEDVPEQWKSFIEVNAKYFAGGAAGGG
jgi:NAD-dependent dihydropyrimidine dehydrogenase PreA subunit